LKVLDFFSPKFKALKLLENRGPIFEKSYDEFTKHLWKSLTYKKLTIIKKSYSYLAKT